MKKMTYEETVELERNIKIKNKAKEIVREFKKNVSLDLSTKKGNRFTIWQDQYNATYIEISKEDIIFVCNFLHEKYSIIVDESNIFNGILHCDKVIGHLASAAKVTYNEFDYRF